VTVTFEHTGWCKKRIPSFLGE